MRGLTKPYKSIWNVIPVVSFYHLDGVPVDAHAKATAIFVYDSLPKCRDLY